NYRVDGYDIEGKTGTAQVADSEGGGYVKGENPYFVSFIGDAPKKNPMLADMQQSALKKLEKNNNGFFLMVEGASIDKT
ncbi:alkaline phosphatase, partial [Staphylococcus hominis]|uniref:alkaline phosphatase n=1 Tax=Staphylococcus hominis TaxID=1290 RepID=UPI0030BB3380